MQHYYRVALMVAIVLTQLCNLANIHGETITPIASVMESLIGSEVLSDNLTVVRRVAAELDVDARFDYLAAWVLPSTDHADIRLIGWFPETKPRSATFLRHADERLKADLPVSPAIDLLHAAVQSGRTEELATRISALPDEHTSQLRTKQILAFMLAVATGNETETAKQLFAMTDAVARQAPDDERTWWPEITGVAFAMQHADRPDGFDEFIQQLFLRRVANSQGRNDAAQDLFVASLNADFNPVTKHSTNQTDATNPFLLWGAASVRKSDSVGRGYGNVTWATQPHAVQKIAGHNRDALYFPCPLTGDFEVQCESTVHRFYSTQLAYGGLSLEESGERNQAKLATVTWDPKTISIEPKLTALDEWVTRRIAVSNGRCHHYLNGRLIYESALRPGHYPWLAIRADRLIRGSVRNLTVTGSPTIPATVQLSDPPVLDDWVAFFTDKDKWGTYQGQDGSHFITGGLRPGYQGMQVESLLLHHRPMMEDGDIEYEFLYVPGKKVVHPAMDLRAFLLNPDGIQIHNVTLGKYQRAALAPDNTSDVIGATGQLPLIPNSWNHVRFHVSGDTIRIALNGQEIFEYEIAADAARQFGFFHYAEQSQAHIRHVRWTGDWQRYAESLPEIAGLPPEIAEIEAAVAQLPKSLHYDFRGTTLSERAFVRPGTTMKQTQQGLAFSASTATSNGSWNQHGVSLAAIAGGDFDIRASYRDVVATGSGDAGVLLGSNTSQQLQGMVISRTQRGGPETQKLKIQAMYENPDGTRRYEDQWVTCEAASGTLRLVRSGTKLHYMMSEGNSNVFRLIATRKVNEHDLNYESIHIAVYADKNASVTGVWTKLSIRAEQLTGPAVD